MADESTKTSKDPLAIEAAEALDVAIAAHLDGSESSDPFIQAVYRINNYVRRCLQQEIGVLRETIKKQAVTINDLQGKVNSLCAQLERKAAGIHVTRHAKTRLVERAGAKGAEINRAICEQINHGAPLIGHGDGGAEKRLIKLPHAHVVAVWMPGEKAILTVYQADARTIHHHGSNANRVAQRVARLAQKTT